MSKSEELRSSLRSYEARKSTAMPLLPDGSTPSHFLRERALRLQQMKAQGNAPWNLFLSLSARKCGGQSPKQIPDHHPPKLAAQRPRLRQVLWKRCMTRASG